MDAIDRLRPFVVLLPRPTAINLNTAPREVLAAVIDKASQLADAERIVQERTHAAALPGGHQAPAASRHAAGPGTTGRRQQLL